MCRFPVTAHKILIVEDDAIGVDELFRWDVVGALAGIGVNLEFHLVFEEVVFIGLGRGRAVFDRGLFRNRGDRGCDGYLNKVSPGS